MIYSASRLESYRQCPYKFKLSYIDGIRSDQEGIEAFVGSRVHEVLETLYTDLKFSKIPSLEHLLDLYRENFQSKWHEAIRIVREERNPEDYFAVGEKCIVDYYHRYHPFDQQRTLGIEYRVKFSLDPEGQYQMQGFVDRLSQPKDKVIWIHDYKTKGYLPTQPELDEDRQLAYYQMAVAELWPDTEEVHLVWHYLIFDQEIHSHRTAEDLEKLRTETIALIQEIESATDYPTKKSGLCTWCEHQAICPQFKHLHETKALTQKEYAKDEGVKLANQLIILQGKESALKKELTEVKAALASFVKQHGVETVFTKSHKVLVKFYNNTKFPGRKDPGRAQLEKLVRDGGKWDEASSLDIFALSKLIDKKGWDPELIAALRALGTPDESPWIKAFPKNEGRRW